MKITKEFTVSRPLPVVWTFFHDVPAVASCMPGAEYLGSKDDGRHAGRVTQKVGPFQASFEGEAEVTYDDAAQTIHCNGKGVDRKGASRGRMTLVCALESAGPDTKVTVDADIQLSGTIAQFGRTGLITEIAGVLIAAFVSNAEARLSPPSAPAALTEAIPASPASTGLQAPAQAPSAAGLLFAALRNWIGSLVRRQLVL